MKKLLIIGANPETTPIVQIAKDMGIYTIVTDYDSNADAKKIADKSYNVDGMDVDGLTALGRREQVDGVLVGVADLLIAPYQKVCQNLNLPCYATEEQVRVFTNKYYFKRKCEEFEIDGVPEYPIHENMTVSELQSLPYPLIVKPVDSCSGKGISLCHNADEMQTAIEKAYAWSKNKTVIAERYMTCDDISIYYTIKDGIPYLSSISDRYTCRFQGDLSPVCIGDVFPSKYIATFLSEYHEKFCKMFQSLKMQNCVIYISAFYEDGKYYVYDPGFRLQGGGFHLILNGANGFDHRKMLIQQALGEEFGACDFQVRNDPYLHGQSAAVVWLLLKEGCVSKIVGMENLEKMDGVSYVVQRFFGGERIEADAIGTEKQVFARLFLVAKDKTALIDLIASLRERIHVTGENQEELILNTPIVDYA